MTEYNSRYGSLAAARTLPQNSTTLSLLLDRHLKEPGKRYGECTCQAVGEERQ